MKAGSSCDARLPMERKLASKRRSGVARRTARPWALETVEVAAGRMLSDAAPNVSAIAQIGPVSVLPILVAVAAWPEAAARERRAKTA